MLDGGMVLHHRRIAQRPAAKCYLHTERLTCKGLQNIPENAENQGRERYEWGFQDFPIKRQVFNPTSYTLFEMRL